MQNCRDGSGVEVEVKLIKIKIGEGGGAGLFVGKLPCLKTLR